MAFFKKLLKSPRKTAEPITREERSYKEKVLVKWADIKELAEKDDVEGAEKSLKEKYEDKQNEQYFYYLDYLMGQLLRIYTERYDEALQYFLQGIKRKEDHAPCYFQSGFLYDTQLDNSEKAREHYEKACALDWSQKPYHHNTAVLYKVKLRDYENAEKHFRACLEIEQTADELTNLGSCLMEQKKTTEAEKTFQEAIKLDADYLDAHKYLAILYFEQIEDYEQAANEFKECARIDPDDADTYFHMAECYKKFGQSKEQKEYYEEAIKRDAKHGPAHCNLAVLLKKAKPEPDIDGAKEHYEAAMESDSSKAIYRFNYGLLLKYDLSQPENAKKEFLTCIDLDPKYPKPYYELGKICEFQEGEFDKAREYYNAALQLDGNMEQVKSALERLDRRANAR